VWTALPFLGTREAEQLLPVDVSCTNDAGVLARSARFAGISATAGTGGRVSFDVWWRDESRAGRVATVRRVRGREFKDQVLIRRNERVGQKGRRYVNGDSAPAAFERLLCL
jgi:hypothetical protein